MHSFPNIISFYYSFTHTAPSGNPGGLSNRNELPTTAQYTHISKTPKGEASISYDADGIPIANGHRSVE